MSRSAVLEMIIAGLKGFQNDIDIEIAAAVYIVAKCLSSWTAAGEMANML
jgi:hypothetical protein